MKKIKLFFHEVVFLAVLGGLFSARTVTCHAIMKGVPRSLIVHQVPAGSFRSNLRFAFLVAAGST